MAVSKEALAVVESIAYRVHETEIHFQRLKLGDEESEEIRSFLDGLKSQVGRFFMKHVDRRSSLRSEARTESDYKTFWNLEKKEKVLPREKTAAHIPLCRFCGSHDLKERRNSVTGNFNWYCNTCRQEDRALPLNTAHVREGILSAKAKRE